MRLKVSNLNIISQFTYKTKGRYLYRPFAIKE